VGESWSIDGRTAQENAGGVGGDGEVVQGYDEYNRRSEMEDL